MVSRISSIALPAIWSARYPSINNGERTGASSLPFSQADRHRCREL